MLLLQWLEQQKQHLAEEYVGSLILSNKHICHSNTRKKKLLYFEPAED